MNEERHDWVRELLSEQLDGSLSAMERDEVERHLAECTECRDVLAGLSEVRRLARALGPIEPPRDLWPAVAAGRSGWNRRGGARLTFNVPQLAAAAVVLIAVSASTAWWALGGGVVPPRADGPTIPALVRPASTPVASSVPDELADELAMLEEALAAGRSRLDAGTVEVLERNLLVIERAIEDSYRALALDPENDFVRDHLERTYARKLEYLRDVTRIVDIAG
jgi:predicted anti-sigma-YlaC factor YlaD